jgi:hypothetical protein
MPTVRIALKALWRAWVVGARAIGRVQSQLILGIVYVAVLPPFALAVRLLVDPLRPRPVPRWHWFTPDERGVPTLDRVRRQF